VRSVRRDGDSATAELAWRWPLGPEGWSYRSTLPLTGAGEQWEVEPATSSIHPDLAAGQVLVAERTAAQRAEVLDRAGAPLVAPTPVVEVGVQPSRSTDPAGLSRTLAALLDVDADALQQRIAAAAPDAFVPVVVLRRSDYEPLRDQLQPLPGTVFRESSLPLAPTRAFARGLLGTAGPVTAELVQASGGRLAAGDLAGLSGLQRSYDERLGGTPGVTVSLAEGDERTELFASRRSTGSRCR
jgi:cell division protein FtsI/penicillin-binding protein 2